MTEPIRDFTGVWTALITPFDEGGDLDRARFAEQIEAQVEGGVTGLVPCGTTGESATLSHAEHLRVIEACVETADGRVPVLAGTGSNATREAVRLTRESCEAGAAGCLVITPYYNKPGPDGLVAHFQALAEAAGDLPLVLYNVPGRTGQDVAPATVARVAAEVPTVRAVKEASGRVERAWELTEGTPDLQVLSGEDALTLPLLASGAVGVISVTSNVDPAGMVRLTEAALDGRRDDALAEQRRMVPLMRALFLETNPGPVKAAMEILGRDSGRLRLPLTPPGDATRTALRDALDHAEWDD